MENYNVVLENNIKAIEKNTGEFNTEKREIENDINLSEAGKSEQKQELHIPQDKIHQDLKLKLEDTKITVRNDLTKKIFSIDSRKELTAYNEAIIQAEKAAEGGNAALNNLLSRYVRMGDKISQLGVLLVAVEKGFSGTIDNYKKVNPEKAEQLDELNEFEEMWGDRRNMQRKFAEKIRLSGPHL